MIKGKFSRIFTSFLIITVVFSLFQPIFASAETNSSKQLKDDAHVKVLEDLLEQQMSILSAEPSMDSTLEKVGDNESVSVIVQLSEEPVALEKGKRAVRGSSLSVAEERSVANKVSSQQKSFEQQLKTNNVNYSKGFTYNYAINAVTINVKGSDLEKILELPGVVSVTADKKVYSLETSNKSNTIQPTMDQSVDLLKIPELWNMGYEGKGIKVAVIDSGIDYYHPDFDGIYKGGYNFVPHDPTLYKTPRDFNDPFETSPEERVDGAPPSQSFRPFETDHGTHVAGTIAAVGNNNKNVKGIAPKVDLYAYRVLGAYGTGYISSIIAGIDKAVEEEMDIINLSLGGGDANQNAPESIAVNNATLAGIVAVVATGNSGPNRESIGSPATSALAISVGNSTLADTINESSSRGPANPFFDIKPDVVAPGTAILSTIAKYSSDADYTDAYARYTGTSMATPHVAGVAALLLSANPNWSPYDVKVALSNTAKVLDTKQFDVFDQGSGRIQPVEAVKAGALAYALDTTEFNGKVHQYEKGTVTFGHVSPNPNGETTVTKQIKVKDLGSQSKNFTVSVDVTKQATGSLSGATVNVNKSSFTLNGEEVLDVTLTVPKGEDSPGNEIQGYIKISNGTTNLSLPFAAEFAKGEGPSGLNYFNADDIAISPNGDGKKDSTNVNLGLFNNHINTYVELWDPANPTAGEYEDGYLGFLTDDFFMSAGKYNITFDGTYTEWGTGEVEKAPEGVYAITFNGSHNGKQSSAYVAPFFIKTTPSEVVLNPVSDEIVEKEYSLTGKVNDKFVDFKTLVQEAFSQSYDVNEYLSVKYSVEDESGNVVDNNKVTLKQDGSFTLALSNLANGKNTVTLTVDDIAGNTASEKVELTVNVEEEEPPQTEINVTLSPSTTEETEGPVTISVSTDSDADLEALKWLEGEKSVEDFVNAGNNIDLSSKAFDVEENGTYTVYAKNVDGVEAVKSITIQNIVIPQPVLTLELTPSTTEPTTGPVTITADVTTSDEIEALKWLKGDKAVSDFADAGTSIDLDSKKFEVNENGTYTVYAKNSAGLEVVATIAVVNIVDEEAPFIISLKPSTTEPTEGPVTITVELDNREEIAELKWLAGEKAVTDFAEAGEVIDLEAEALSFEVSENGIYTVYAKDSEENEVVQQISITNIGAVEPDPGDGEQPPGDGEQPPGDGEQP
ncbi:S8 family serine peptidase, partial [Alkalihalobacterium bogoriense]|uniref:S8 family serine peptidase n=1 Tax=Alkalihalobacterium bogoriense TaxID=246272 RepID=UPI000551A023